LEEGKASRKGLSRACNTCLSLDLSFYMIRVLLVSAFNVVK